MPPVTSISSCFNCEKVFSLVDQLSKKMQEFEVFTLEMEFDIKSAKSKSQEVLSNFWQLISTIRSLTILNVEEKGNKEMCENQSSSGLVVSVEKSEVESQNIEDESEPADSRSKSKLKRPQQSKPHFKVNPNPNQTEKRSMELQRAKQLLRTIKCETTEGYYNVFECIKCTRQFSHYSNGISHIKVVHLNLGTRCPTCSKRYFDKQSLELHIPKCYKNKQKQFKHIKVFLKSDLKSAVKVHLHPHQNQEQKEMRPTQNVSGKLQNQRGKTSKDLDLSRLNVRNPYPNFSIVKALNVKVVIQRLKTEEIREISITSQTQSRTSEPSQIETGTGKGTSSSKSEVGAA